MITSASLGPKLRERAHGARALPVAGPARGVLVGERVRDLRVQLGDERAARVRGEQRLAARGRWARVEGWVEGTKDEPAGEALGCVW